MWAGLAKVPRRGGRWGSRSATPMARRNRLTERLAASSRRPAKRRTEADKPPLRARGSVLEQGPRVAGVLLLLLDRLLFLGGQQCLLLVFLRRFMRHGVGSCGAAD